MFTTLKTAEELQTWILEELGAPVVKVELAVNHLRNSVDGAIRWFSAKKGVTQRALFMTIEGQDSILLPPEVGVVTDVLFPSPEVDVDIFSPWFEFSQGTPWTSAGHGSTGGVFSYWVQTRQYLETTRRLFHGDPDWVQQGNILQLVGRIRGGPVLLEYRSNSFSLAELTEFDHDLIRRNALARAKKILGRIRSKYEGFPSAQGNVAMDGNTLLQEADSELQLLDEEIMGSGYPLGFMVG